MGSAITNTISYEAQCTLETKLKVKICDKVQHGYSFFKVQYNLVIRENSS